MISYAVGDIHISARRYDEAIVVCKNLAAENPTLPLAHDDCLSRAYRGKRMYPQVIEEWKIRGQLTGDRHGIEFASRVTDFALRLPAGARSEFSALED